MPLVPPRLLLFTDAAAPRRHGRCLLATLALAFDEIVVDRRADVAVCVRDKGIETAATLQLCRAVRAVLAAANVSVFVHGHVDVAAALGLEGVHLPSTTPPAEIARARQQLLSHTAVVGLSAHPTDDAPLSTRDDVDYVSWSPIFSPASKVDARAPLGLQALGGHRTPVLALGGVDVDNAASCLGHGAAGVAVIGAVLGTAQPRRALLGLLDACAIAHRKRRASAA